MAHNPLFTKLVSDNEDKLLGMVAYAIYKTFKKEWIQAFECENARSPNAVEIASYAATWTPQLIQNATDAASSALAEFASEAIDEARPGILQEALKGGAVRSVLLNMLAALLYTVFLIFVVMILRASGIDIFSISTALSK